MTVRVSCENCKHALTAPARLAGKTVRCPKCRKGIAVPSQDTQADAGTYGFQSEDKIAMSRSAAPAQRRTRPVDDDDSIPLRLAEDEKAKEEKPTIEVQLEDGEVRSFVKAWHLKKLLLDGTITRHNKARSIAPQPTLGDVSTHDGVVAMSAANREQLLQEMIKLWREQCKWRPIGDGLAQEEESLRSMYEHRFRKWYNLGGAVLFLGSWLVIGPILFIVFSTWDPGPREPEERVNPRMRGHGDALAPLVQTLLTPKVVGVGFALIVLLVITGYLALEFGARIAPLLAKICGDDGEPPDDGFVSATNETNEADGSES